ncbi:hypothetical protein DU500_04005 [Haloplanus rubicundus]|uniref:Uncharacterized protein n=2 Tax=Haloplanus rubicundus TaxID=1547898 RepID=A0A345E0E3_9EURY|nr:hypothetical protein DU500_04005 [Haloplanus rubicundus]
MPNHTVELGTRELTLLMELVSEAIEEGRYHYPDESALRRMHRKAEAALGTGSGSAVIEESETTAETDDDLGSDELRDSEISYCGPSLDDLLGDSGESEKFR